MRKGSNNDILSNRLQMDRKYYLLYQVWTELTEHRTMDSYQYRVMNVLSILQELTEVIDLQLKNITKGSNNLNECRLEACSIIRQDIVLNSHYVNIRKILLSHLSKTPEKDPELRALRYQISYCYHYLTSTDNTGLDYFGNLINDLETAVMGGNKSNTIKLSNAVVSCCIDRGWSVDGLNDVVCLLNGSITDTTRFDVFKNRLLGNESRNYRIIIPDNLSYRTGQNYPRPVALDRIGKKIDELSASRIQILSAEDVRSRLPDSCHRFIKESRYLVLEASAYDQSSAAVDAIEQCAEILNVLSFYQDVDPWKIDSLICLVWDERDQHLEKITIADLYRVYDYMENSSQKYSISREYLASANSIHNSLTAVYSYLSMGRAQINAEERFMNSWIPLESLSRSDVYDSIIPNILDTVPAALCIRYICQLFRNFIEDCLRCKIRLRFIAQPIDLQSIRDHDERVKKLIEIMNDETLYAELKAMCSVSDLLEIRCDEMHSLAINHRNLNQRVADHYLTVRMQLGRLYRMRNKIAHHAMVSHGSMLIYVEHLDDYLLKFVGQILSSSKKYCQYDPKVLFEMFKDNYKLFVDIKQSKEGEANPLLNDFYQTGILDLI